MFNDYTCTCNKKSAYTPSMCPYVDVLCVSHSKAAFFGDGADHYVIMWSWHIMFNIVSALVYLAWMENGLTLQLYALLMLEGGKVCPFQLISPILLRQSASCVH